MTGLNIYQAQSDGGHYPSVERYRAEVKQKSLTSKLVKSSQRWYAFRKQNWLDFTVRSWYPCLLHLETRTRVVIPVTGCSQRLTESNLQSCAWTRSQVISSMTKTPSPPLLGTSSILQKAASQGQPQSQKSPTLGLTNNAGKCWRLDRPWAESSTEEGIGLHLLNDETRPSGLISCPSQVGISNICLCSIN